MKVIAINGSPRKDGNTSIVLKTVLKGLENQGIEGELIHIGAAGIRGCTACGMCAKNHDKKCVLKDQGVDVNEIIQKMIDADGHLLGAPVHYAGIAGTMKSFLDRSYYVAGSNGRLFRHKVGAGIVSLRRSGGSVAIDQINKYFQISEMLMPAANYWNIVHGMKEGEAVNDLEGMQIAGVLGKNMAWLLKMIEHSRGTVEVPTKEDKIAMNFVR